MSNAILFFVIEKPYLWASVIFVSLAWLIPAITLKLSLHKLGKLTISTFADSKYSWIYKSLLLTTSIFLSSHILLNYQSLISRFLVIIMQMSALLFIFFTLRNNSVIHKIFAFIFFSILSYFCLACTANVFSLMPVTILNFLILQVYLKKGNAVSVLLLTYISWLAILLG